jgi:uncharacterized protein YbgA (DUF1722 family)
MALSQWGMEASGLCRDRDDKRPSAAAQPRYTNVLQHLAGYVSAHLDGDEREELTAVIEQYRRGFLPLIVPVTLIRHYVRKFHVTYLLYQVYLSPHPHELMLLNHV